LAEADPKVLLNFLLRPLAREPRGSGRMGPPIAWASTRGLVRQENQDRLLVAQARTGLVVAGVADGMGGMKDGSRAAAVALGAATAYCMTFPHVRPTELLAQALSFANDEVFKILNAEGGAVLVMAAFVGGERYIAHAGDARAYQVPSEGLLSQLTTDDTIRGQLKNLGRARGDASKLNGDLLQFVGMGDDFEPHVRPAPSGGRGLLLTSDGIHGLPPHILDWVVAGTGHLQLVAERLSTASEWAGGHDNGSILAVSTQSEYAVALPAGMSEIWVPGEHVVVMPDETNRIASVDSAPKPTERKPKARKPRAAGGRKRQRSDQAPPASASDRQLPIVEFKEAPSPELHHGHDDNGVAESDARTDTQIGTRIVEDS
jgi:PPM family protein phosphatase